MSRYSAANLSRLYEKEMTQLRVNPGLYNMYETCMILSARNALFSLSLTWVLVFPEQLGPAA
jgi:hypothetical protein